MELIKKFQAFAHRNDVKELMAAARAGDVEKLNLLKKRHADLNALDSVLFENALMKAAACGRTSFVQALVDAKVDLNSVSAFGLSALDMAEIYKRQGCITVLEDAGAKNSPMRDMLKRYAKEDKQERTPNPQGGTSSVAKLRLYF